MSRKDWQECAKEMIVSCKEIISATQDLGYDHFNSDPKIHKVVSENIQQLGTVAYDLPQIIFDLYPKIDWRGLVAMGFALGEAKDFCQLKDIVLWIFVEDEVPELLPTLQHLLKEAKRKK